MYLLNIKEGSGGLREVGQMVIQSTLIVDATDFAEAKEIVREWVDSKWEKVHYSERIDRCLQFTSNVFGEWSLEGAILDAPVVVLSKAQASQTLSLLPQ